MIGLLSAMLRMSVPYVLAALGGTVAELSGVVSLALEGMLLSGAFAATLAAHLTGSGAIGVLGGVAGGVLIALLLGGLVIGLGADAVVSGVALNLLADGATRFFLKVTFGSASNSPRVAALGQGTIFGGLGHPVLLLTPLLVALFHVLVYRTRFGLRLRAAGEHPEAARSLGVVVGQVRFAAVVACGALAGLGGAWLAVDERQFVAGMSSGRGYIAIAAVILGRWRPIGGAIAALAFAAAEAVEIALQAASIGVPDFLVQMLPYLATLIALAGLIGRSRPPRALSNGS